MDWIEPVHQLIGYPLAFLVVPLALWTFGGTGRHRWFGWICIGVMIFLYLTGLFMTLTRHEWGSWAFYRNLSFNFFGFSLLFYGYRAIYLFRNQQVKSPSALDYCLAILLTITVVSVFSVAVIQNTAMRVFALVGIWLVYREWRELMAGFQLRQVLYRRHYRYLLACYCYVLTVASLVHLGEELSRNTRWLWPTALGFVLLVIMRWAEKLPVARRRMILQGAVFSLIAVAVLFGSYAVWEIGTGAREIDFPNGMDS